MAREPYMALLVTAYGSQQARAQTFWGAGAQTKKRAPNAKKKF